jgi:hypothetical protein
MTLMDIIHSTQLPCSSPQNELAAVRELQRKLENRERELREAIIDAASHRDRPEHDVCPVARGGS